MDNQLKRLIQAELDELSQLENKLEARQKQFPSSSLNVMTRNGKNPMFYEYDSQKKGIFPNGKYINKKNQHIACILAQKEYESAYLMDIKKKHSALDLLLAEYSESSEESVRKAIHPAKYSIIQRILPSDEEYISNWLKANPGSLNTYPFKAEYDTERGEIVRSKSEKIIADMLYANNIPYVYEPQIQLANGQFIYPDFKVLNVQTRKEYIWEHFGKMGDTGYSLDMCDKFNKYLTNNYWPGDRLIITCESSENGVNIKTLKKILRRYLQS